MNVAKTKSKLNGNGNNHEPGFLEEEAKSIKEFHEKMREREEREAEMKDDEEDYDEDEK